VTGPAIEEPSRPAWSWHADWTEPLRRDRVPVAVAAVLGVALLAWRLGPRPDLPAFAYLMVVGVALTAVDVRLRRLPDPLTLPSYGAGLVLLGAAAPFTPGGGDRLTAALTGLAALWALFAVQWFIVPSAMGFGDVKLSGVLGLYLGWLGPDAWVLGVLAMFLLGGLYSAVLLIVRRARFRSTIPFGPFMLAGTLTGVLLYA
jgi:leader peptidase (prepilin peptidase) / N-methyltransferase